MLPLEFGFSCDKNDMIVNFPELWPNSSNAKKYSGICKKKLTFLQLQIRKLKSSFDILTCPSLIFVNLYDISGLFSLIFIRSYFF